MNQIGSLTTFRGKNDFITIGIKKKLGGDSQWKVRGVHTPVKNVLRVKFKDLGCEPMDHFQYRTLVLEAIYALDEVWGRD